MDRQADEMTDRQTKGQTCKRQTDRHEGRRKDGRRGSHPSDIGIFTRHAGGLTDEPSSACSRATTPTKLYARCIGSERTLARAWSLPSSSAGPARGRIRAVQPLQASRRPGALSRSSIHLFIPSSHKPNVARRVFSNSSARSSIPSYAPHPPAPLCTGRTGKQRERGEEWAKNSSHGAAAAAASGGSSRGRGSSSRAEAGSSSSSTSAVGAWAATGRAAAAAAA